MISDREAKHLSKFLSLVLRHQPELIGVKLDAQGWVDVDALLIQCDLHGTKINRETLDYLVETNSKKRFAFSDDRLKIRASQGHSVEIDLGYTAQEPPEILYHGTGSQHIEAILASGLEKRQRHHVHLSRDIDTALMVGQRHGKPAVFEVTALAMHQRGHLFYLSENGVWLTDVVPAEFLKLY